MLERYLTKSLFKMAMDCPTKLYYSNKTEYADHNLEDQFLLSLAEGGFQVGELAKCYIPGGYQIDTLNYENSLLQTDELIKRDQVIIYEAAFRYKNLFVRADILIKNKSHIELIEVKAKSFSRNSDSFINERDGSIRAMWKPYLYDLAFQKYVISNALPGHSISANLMLADKNTVCPTDGLNQKFKIVRDHDGRKKIKVDPTLSNSDVSNRILSVINTDECCYIIDNMLYKVDNNMYSFAEMINIYADAYKWDVKIRPVISSKCKTCEFCTNEKEKQQGLKIGFEECWKASLGWSDSDFNEPNVMDIWNFRNKDIFINSGRIKLDTITIHDISPCRDDRPGISVSQRQWLQVEKAQNNDLREWIDHENLSREMSQWVYPLHFIDFETTMTAIPFNRGRRPYEGIAFQFSHHVVYKDGTIEHYGQYLNTQPGVFPNYEFVRELYRELKQDEGSIFRYAAHENTFLCLIYRQLMEDRQDIPDRVELCDFIKTITQSITGYDKWVGKRNMIDMCELVKRYYYNPATKGSNSIKQVLPAIINSSAFLQNKYSRPIYGANGGIKSLNYKDWKWIEYEGGKVKDPYKLLPRMFLDVSDKDFELLSESDELRDGGAALTAYARMQFEEMSDYERAEISNALLKYCELDTLAMVMIYEGWRNMCGA